MNYNKTLSNQNFHTLFDAATGGLTSLKHVNDTFDTDYIMAGETLGPVVMRYRIGEGDWREADTLASSDIRQVKTSTADMPASVTVSYAGKGKDDRGVRNFRLSEQFALEQDGLVWTLRFSNATDRPLELGDIALPLLFNTSYDWDNLTTYTKRLIKHSFIAGHGAFIYWMRPNGVGPYLVMTPLPNTKLEYYEAPDLLGTSGWEGPYQVYIHSAVQGAGETRGTWRQPHTSVTLSPQGQPGEEVVYGFKFRWANDYQMARNVLFEEGQFDIHVVPGMTVPVNLEAMVSLRTKNNISSVTPEHPAQTQIEYLGEQKKDIHLYKIKFARLGENQLLVNYGRNQYLTLEFFVTEALKTLIKKRSAFLVNKQQHRDPAKWYNGLFSQWDMRHAVLRGPDDTDGFDGWWGYVLACDDTALSKAPFIAAKNLYYPVQEEIDAIEYYLEHFVWGKLQRTDEETPYPYGIYGVPNWYENRHSDHGFGSDGQGQEKLWRTYDYPHLMMVYFHLYQIAKYYGMTTYLDQQGYLERAFGTAKAFFLVPYDIKRIRDGQAWWPDRAYKEGNYNELLIVDLIEALYAEGWAEQADWLKAEWEKKVKYFAYDAPYPFQSEWSFDSTAFESTHAIVKYGLANSMQPDEKLWHDKNKDRWYSHPQTSPKDFEPFMDKQIEANIACRGWLETAYYYLGSDYRQFGSSMYLLSYMSQMGGWSLLDYALYHAPDPTPYLRLGYNAYLSSWALLNTGTPESNYGYWYPGRENDGAAGWAYKPEKFGPIWVRDARTDLPREQARGAWHYDGEIDLGFCGALRMAATVVTDDPLFGLLALGGQLSHSDDGISVIPRDGLRQRLHVIWGAQRLHLLLGRDGFAAEQPIIVAESLHRIRFTLENRTANNHTTLLRIAGLPPGDYTVYCNGESITEIVIKANAWLSVYLPIIGADTCEIVIRNTSDDFKKSN